MTDAVERAWRGELFVARAISVVGDRWTLLILRDCFLRVRRFEDFQERLGSLGRSSPAASRSSSTNSC
jgi:DNA-binding HxlR family transcriptional regulator